MLPDPLHPAVVHFPIVLLLLGAPLAVVAVFLRRWHLPVLAAVVLTMGAAGAVVATVTGEQDSEVAGELAGTAEKVLEEHEEWGERARNFGVIAAVLAVISAAISRMPVAGRALGAIAAMAALAAAASVAQAGHYGGQVVYQHGIGVGAAAGNAAAQPSGGGEEGRKKKHHDESDR
jgi:uncharacterized membrane protein